MPQAQADGSANPTDQDLAKFDATLRQLVPANKLFTPDDLRLKNATLRDAVFPPNACALTGTCMLPVC